MACPVGNAPVPTATGTASHYNDSEVMAFTTNVYSIRVFVMLQMSLATFRQ